MIRKRNAAGRKTHPVVIALPRSQNDEIRTLFPSGRRSDFFIEQYKNHRIPLEEKVIWIPLERPHPFAGHPCKVLDDNEMNCLILVFQ